MKQCGYWKLSLNQTFTFKNTTFSLAVCNPPLCWWKTIELSSAGHPSQSSKITLIWVKNRILCWTHGSQAGAESINVAESHTRLKGKPEANMESKTRCLLLPAVWYLLNVVSCGPAENRGPGVTEPNSAVKNAQEQVPKHCFCNCLVCTMD